MIKKLVYIFMLVLGVQFVQAQEDYVPFPKSDAEWDVLAFKYPYSMYDPYYRNPFSYTIFEEDTIIDGVNYPSILLFNGRYFCAVREEDKRVYVYLDGFGEQLLYDFNLNVGDTIFYNIAGHVEISGLSFDEFYNKQHYRVVTSLIQ